MLRCSIRIRISCFHIVPLLPVVCCCFLACLGILDKVLSVCDTYLRFNRNTNVIFEITTYECETKCKESIYFGKHLNTIVQVDFIFRTIPDYSFCMRFTVCFLFLMSSCKQINSSLNKESWKKVRR